MQYLSSIYFFNQPLHVAGMFIVHYLEVFILYVQQLVRVICLTLSLLMSYIYIYIYIYGALCKARKFKVVCIYRPTFGNAESYLFLFAAQCFNIESMQKKLSCVTVVCKHFASYPNYIWDLIR
jgi:hypothetical protein